MDLMTDIRVIAEIQEPKIDYQAALYFLDGHYLFRSRDGAGWRSKFVTATDVASAFTGSEVDSGWLPAGVVRAGSNAKGRWFVYSTPAQKIKVIFDGEEQPLTIPLPRLVLLGMGTEFHLWAMNTKHFISSATAYHAPFPNIYDSGMICWGSNTPKPADPGDAREVWELFFSTPFNAHLASGKSQEYKSDVRQQLRALAGKREYPVNDLVSCRYPISYCIDSALGVR